MAVQMKATDGQSSTDPCSDGKLCLVIEKMLGGSGRDRFALSIRTDVPPGITVLFGASGAGKTTVLNCVAGLQRPDAGRIVAGERVLFDSVHCVDIATERRRIGYVFQNLALFPHMTALQNVAYGITARSSSERTLKAKAILESMRIAHLTDRQPRDISGGERQRVALARALVTEPSVLLLDEPLSGLDLPTKVRIIDDLRSWNDQHRIPVLYVTHSRDEAFSLAERVVIMDHGRLIAEGTPYEVFDQPEHELLAQLAGFENILDATVLGVHPERGTMTCAAGAVHLEIPSSRAFSDGSQVRIAIRAGDILVATSRPQGLSARNIISGRILSVTRRDLMMVAQVDCGVMFEVHLTPQACESLTLHAGSEIWLVMKTHSFHLLRRAGTL